MKKGFVLLELLIALVIASMVGLALFSGYTQTQRSVRVADSVMERSRTLSLIGRQMERDISGAFIPLRARIDEATEKTEKKEEGDESESLTHVFASTNNGDLLSQITFITNNPLQVYWSDRAGGARPRIARVVYKLEPSAQQLHGTQSYTLKRYESSELDYTKFTQKMDTEIKGFALADNIKQLSVSFVTLVELEPEEGQEQGKPEQKNYTVWDERDTQSLADQGITRRVVPHVVSVQAAVWDDQRKRSTPLVFVIPIIPDLQTDGEKEPEKKVEAIAPVQEGAAPPVQQQVSMNDKIIMLTRALGQGKQ